MLRCRVCGGQQVIGWDCGPESGDWFTRFLGKPDDKGPGDKYHLLFNPGIAPRQIDRRPHLYVNWPKPEDHVSPNFQHPKRLVFENLFRLSVTVVKAPKTNLAYIGLYER
jgi:hypothetical protein